MQDRLTHLADIDAAIWRELSRATHDRHHEWRTVVLATVAQRHGEAVADARNVVLREVAAHARQLVIYTDARAAKAQQLRTHPQASIVMWSRRLGWQLRCQVRLTIDTAGAAVDSRWSQVRQTAAAHDYLSPQAPGRSLPAASTTAPAAAPATSPITSAHHFAVVTAQVDAIDWLELHREGHRRAQFSSAAAQWLQP